LTRGENRLIQTGMHSYPYPAASGGAPESWGARCLVHDPHTSSFKVLLTCEGIWACWGLYSGAPGGRHSGIRLWCVCDRLRDC